ncbi:kelch repeat and BTB domain-containing protein 2-like isoform X2 [Branchiostoma floridae x Branchiostoma japonicum]
MAATGQRCNASAVRPRSYQDESYLHGFLETVGDLQKAGVLQDVILEVEGRRFPCHRLVLSAASPYFRAMFTSGMAESRQKTVVLQGLESDIFGEILSYIYSATLHVSLDKVQPLYQAADLLQLDNVAYREDFYSLSVNQLIEIIRHDELDVKEETTVWEAVVRWVQHSREDRLHHLPSILPHIRFNLLTPYNMVAILEHPLVREDPGRSAIRNVVKETANEKRRIGMDTQEMAMIFPEDNSDLKPGEQGMLFWNPRAGKYIKCSYPKEALALAQRTITVTSDNDIYILAREVPDLSQVTVLEFNNVGNVWQPAGLPPVRWPKTVHSHRLVEVDGVLYLFSEGWTVKNDSASVWVQMTKYNWYMDEWQKCSKLELGSEVIMSEYLPVSCGSHFYLIMNTDMYRYDPSQDRWCKRTPPKFMPDVCTAVSLGTEIFCTDRQFTKTMVYDTESDRWQVLQGWPNPDPGERAVNTAPSLFVLDNQLHVWLEPYIVDTDEIEDHLVYVYDRSADAWKDLKATLPYNPYSSGVPMSPVARIYLPGLTVYKDAN